MIRAVRELTPLSLSKFLNRKKRKNCSVLFYSNYLFNNLLIAIIYLFFRNFLSQIKKYTKKKLYFKKITTLKVKTCLLCGISYIL